jgi:hypothetical protein
MMLQILTKMNRWMGIIAMIQPIATTTIVEQNAKTTSALLILILETPEAFLKIVQEQLFATKESERRFQAKENPVLKISLVYSCMSV